MVTKSEAKYLRISPKKVRPILELVKGNNPQEAINKLEFINKKGARFLQKLIKTSLADAKNKGYQESSLFISKLVANQGPALKRHRAASFGRASLIRKRMSCLVIELDSTDKVLAKE